MARIQQQLLRDDAFLLDHRNCDPADLARRAGVVASSERAGGEAALVTSGRTRAVAGPPQVPVGAEGNQWQNVLAELATGESRPLYTVAPPDRAHAGLHRWMSDPAAGLPAWLELTWDEPVAVREVQLIFDTGLHRFLTLSQADGYTRRMEWGHAQPETVRDYVIAAETSRGWTTLASVAGNYQRRRVHAVPVAVRTRRLRITVTATNGLDHARLVEVRVYA